MPARRILFIFLLLSSVFITLSALFLFKRNITTFKNIILPDFLAIGKEMPLGPGNGTFAPYKKIPRSKFYVNIASRDMFWCIQGMCGYEGAYVQTMGGWLEVYDSPQAVSEVYGLQFGEGGLESIVIIGDQNAKIAGIYPNKDFKDLLSILKLHPELADFGLLKGVDEFGPLEVGEMSPIKPGDQTGYAPGAKTAFEYKEIPKGKKFYVYSVEKNLLGKEYCAFYECAGGPYDCECEGCHACARVEELGGWFSSDGRPETAMLFGLDPEKVKKGETSLVVVTNPEGKILALHPGKTKDDFITILHQLSLLAD